MVTCCGSPLKNSLFNSKHRLDISSDVKQVKERLTKALNDIGVLGLEKIVQHQTPSIEVNPSWRESTSVVCEPIVYGRDDEKKEIICRLLNDEPNYANFVVVPIVGLGGVGKTTLAQAVYNDDQVEKVFQVKAWVCVSDPFDRKRITSIVNSITDQNKCDFSDLNQAQGRLNDVLKGKRFLIILYDVWSERYDEWDSLQIPFREGARGSRVIATTRSQEVTKIMNPKTSSMIMVKSLSDDDCWGLFLRHAFENTNIELSPKFASMKCNILRKCKGLPLAARTLGGLLRTKSEESQWHEILNSNIWSKEDSHVLQVLKLSYHYLPYHLKPCFANCAIFPKDFQFEEDDLILLWMAEGLIPEHLTKRMEDIGHDYFSDIVSRSFFEQVGSWKLFKMHDLISDLAQWVVEDVHLMMDNRWITEDHNKDHGRARYISFNGNLLK